MSRYWSVALCVILAACSAQLPQLPDATVGGDALLSGERLPAELLGEALPALTPVEWLAADKAMLAFLDSQSADIPRHQLPRYLARALLASPAPSMQYQRGANLSASTVFEERRANCLSFSAMMVSLLRAAGLDARFQRVVAPPEWDLRETSVVASLHVNTRVQFDRVQQEIDWARFRPKSSLDRKTLMSDAEALAELYNNRGTEAMLAGDPATAFANLRRALELAPRTAHIWVNLGAFYRRQDDNRAAESAWLIALQHEPGQLQALSNLQRAFQSAGREKVAGELAAVLRRYRDGNPFFHFALAKQAMSEERFEDAITHLERALLLERDPRFKAMLRQARQAAGGDTELVVSRR